MRFNKHILKNGLRVITIPMPENPAVTVLVMVEAGSRYETKPINGISHFLEHMVFKGTPKRPKAIDISKELDGLGAESNAFTSDEYTGYYAKVDPMHIDKALDIISDIYLNPIFEEKEINKEKGVIIEEIRMYKDRPQSQVFDALGNLMYGDQPAGWTVLGPEDNIRKFSRKHFLDYRSKHYVADSTIVIVSGSFDEKLTLEKIEKLFSKISKGPKSLKKPIKESQSKPQLHVIFKKTDQTHLAISVRTFSAFDKRSTILRVMSAVLGKGMSSRLFSKMRDDLGICYYIRSSNYLSTDHGNLSISAGVDTSRVDIGIKNIIQELNRLKVEHVSEQELKKAKDYLAGTMMLNLETSDSQAEFVGYQEILKKEIKLPAELIEDMKKVTAEEIKSLAMEIFSDKGLNMSIIGPYKEKDKKRFEKLLTFEK